VIERAARELVYARAGHDRPLLLRAGASQELDAKGTVLGLLGADMLGLSEERITLISGDRLVLYTYGLTDMMAPDGQLFNRVRLESMLRRYAALGPVDLCDAVFSDLAAYQARLTSRRYDAAGRIRRLRKRDRNV
jgi:serine phosphatase RsbU (regulator of sigma subunit)